MSNITCQPGLRTNSCGSVVRSPWIIRLELPDDTICTVWPGEWPCAAIDAMPGATSLPGSYLVILLPMMPNTRRTLANAAFIASGARLMLPSSIQKSHSGPGTMTSAFG